MITFGFGTRFDVKCGTSRQWYVKRDGIVRWADNDQPLDADDQIFRREDTDARNRASASTIELEGGV